jgi:hypothetical protein
MNNLICINKDLCMSKNYFFLLLIIFIGMTIYYIKITKRNAENKVNEYKKILYKINTTNKLQESTINNNNNNNNTSLINTLPVRKLLEYRDKLVLYDPLVAPERRVDITQYPLPIINKINIPTRGYPDNYQLVGLLSRIGDEKILQLFGRPTFPGSNQYEYYATTESNGFTNKIPIETKGKREIEDGIYVKVPIFDESKGDFQVKLYNYDTPRYNTYIF